MPVSIRIDTDPGLAIITCTGALAVGDAEGAAQSLWNTPGWLATAAVWDFRCATFDMSSSDVRRIANFILQNQPERAPRRVAFVVGRDVDYGLARVFNAYRVDPGTRFRVFRDFDEAIGWAK